MGMAILGSGSCLRAVAVISSLTDRPAAGRAREHVWFSGLAITCSILRRRELRPGAEPVALRGVWGGRILSDSPLTTRLNAVRKAVNDSGAAQRVIRTVHRKGVRFIGEVSEDGESPARVELVPAATEPRIAARLSIAMLPFAN